MSVRFEQLLCMKNHILNYFSFNLLISCNDTENPDYLNESLPVDTRVEDLMVDEFI